MTLSQKVLRPFCMLKMLVRRPMITEPYEHAGDLPPPAGQVHARPRRRPRWRTSPRRRPRAARQNRCAPPGMIPAAPVRKPEIMWGDVQRPIHFDAHHARRLHVSAAGVHVAAHGREPEISPHNQRQRHHNHDGVVEVAQKRRPADSLESGIGDRRLIGVFIRKGSTPGRAGPSIIESVAIQG